jgi:hypothetical protein
MPYTMQQVVDKARIPLNDVAKDRVSDATLLSYANDAILLLRNKRPDLFFGQYLTLSTLENLALSANLPLPAELYPMVSDYVTARAETINDESVLSQRADMFMRFVSGQV